MKRQVIRGAVVLSAAALAALTACSGNEGTTENLGGDRGGDGDATGGKSSASGGASSGGDSGASGGASTGGSSTGGSSTGGTDMGGAGGEPEPVSLSVNAACPLPDSSYYRRDDALISNVQPYRHFDRSGAGEFSGFSLVEGTAQDDRAHMFVQGGVLCVVTGDGDDVIESEFTGGETLLTLSGGLGADIFAMTYYGPYPGTVRQYFDIVDFEPGVDTLYFDKNGFDYSDNPAAPIDTLIMEFDGDLGQITAGHRAIVVDPTDGEVWFASNYGESSVGLLGSINDADKISVDDIQLGVTVEGCTYPMSSSGDYRWEASTSVANYFSLSTSSHSGAYFLRIADDGTAERVVNNPCVAGSSQDDTFQLLYPDNSGQSAIVSTGPGADTLVYTYPSNEASQPGVFTITDFTPGEDKLVFESSNMGIYSGSEGLSLHTADITTASSLDATHLHVDLTDGEIYFNFNSLPVKIMQLNGAPALTVNDFELIDNSP